MTGRTERRLYARRHSESAAFLCRNTSEALHPSGDLYLHYHITHDTAFSIAIFQQVVAALIFGFLSMRSESVPLPGTTGTSVKRPDAISTVSKHWPQPEPGVNHLLASAFFGPPKCWGKGRRAPFMQINSKYPSLSWQTCKKQPTVSLIRQNYWENMNVRCKNYITWAAVLIILMMSVINYKITYCNSLTPPSRLFSTNKNLN